jgi:Peptidase family M28
VIDALPEIEALVACEGRWAGSEGERRAGEHLAGRLRSLARDVQLEPAVVHPDYPLTYVLHILLALVGGAVSTRRPKLGAAALSATIVSAFGDSNGRFHLLRRLTGRAVTHNVLSRERSGKAGTLVLLAHYDAAKTGWLFNPKALERRARLSRRIGIDIDLFEPFVWSLQGLLGVALLRAVGVKGRALNATRILPMLTLAAHLPLLFQIRASEAVPGAADNASGVATVLRLADRYGRRLRHFDVWVLFTGAEEGLMLGMREWVRRHRHELDPQRTIFLNIDEAGYGTVRYATSEGHDVARRNGPTLSDLCDEIREEARAGGFEAQPMPELGLADASLAARYGYKAIRIACLPEPTFAPEYHRPTDTPERLDAAALERAFEFCSQLIERIDERLLVDSVRAEGQRHAVARRRSGG